MALSGKTISSLSAASALTGAELLPAVQGGANVRTTTQAVGNLPLTGELRSTYNAAGILSASQATAGFAITSNYDGTGEVEIWNIVNAGTGVSIYQKTGAATASKLAKFSGDATFSQCDFFVNNVSKAQLYVDAAEMAVSSTENTIDLTLYAGPSGSLTGANIIAKAPLQYCSDVINKTTDFSPSSNVANSKDFGINYTNIGAVATVVVTLPSAVAGWRARFTVEAAQIFRMVAPASTTISVGATTSAVAGNIQASVKGATVELEAISATEYVAMAIAGSWTVT
jgi:hypothetical protein